MAISYAQPQSPPTEITGGPTFERPAPSTIIQKANEYVIGFVGEDYFNSKFSLNDSYTSSDVYLVKYNYNIPYSYVHTGVLLFIYVNNESIEFYEGPKKAYSFTITEQKAVEIAKNNGLQNPVDNPVIEYLYGVCETGGLPRPSNKKPNCLIIDGYVWDVSGGDFNARKTFYIDVDSGALLYSINGQSVQSATPPSDFKHPKNPSYDYTHTRNVLTLAGVIILILIIIILFIWFKYFRK